MSAVVKALAALAHASHADGPPTDQQRDLWREQVAEGRREHDELTKRLRDQEARISDLTSAYASALAMNGRDAR